MKFLITGGAGFIGTNLTRRLLLEKQKVTIFDNFSRFGARDNARRLQDEFRINLNIVYGDVCNFSSIKKEVKDKEVIFHLAGQVAVTTSVTDPRNDFNNNLIGSFNVLEAARIYGSKPIIIDSSTNKVYGETGERTKEAKTRYIDAAHKNGIDERQPLDFYSPYGCSKGAADSYIHDYYRIYGLPTVIFRQSCIYGKYQYGIEDQGWLAYFVICALKGKPITLYGAGKQVRDVLYVDDLIDAYLRAVKEIDKVKGEIFNIGGGVSNTISLFEAVQKIEKIVKKKITLKYGLPRPGDQRVYISNIKKAKELLKWQPKIDLDRGLEKLYDWVKNIV